MGAGRAPADQRHPSNARHQLHGQGPDNSIRAFRDEVIAAIGTKNLVDVRSPTSSPARSWRRLICHRNRASGPGIPGAINVRGAGPPTRTAPSSPTRNWPRSTPRPAWTARRRPSLTAASVSVRRTPGFVLQELLGHQNVKNYDGSWTEYGSWWAPRSSWEVDYVLSTETRTDVARGRRRREGNRHHRPVIDGRRVRPSVGAFVRLLDGSDEFTAEVVASATGDFRFFAAPGTWTFVRCRSSATATPWWRPRAPASTRSTSRSRDDDPARVTGATRPRDELRPAPDRGVVLRDHAGRVRRGITWFALYALYRLITDES